MPRKKKNTAASDHVKVIQLLRDCLRDGSRSRSIPWDYLDLNKIDVLMENNMAEEGSRSSSVVEDAVCFRGFVTNTTDLWCKGALQLVISLPAKRTSPAMIQRLVKWLLRHVDPPHYGVLLDRPAFHLVLFQLVAVWGAGAAHWIAGAIDHHLGWRNDATRAAAPLSSSSARCPCCNGRVGKKKQDDDDEEEEGVGGPPFRTRLCRSGRFLRNLFTTTQMHASREPPLLLLGHNGHHRRPVQQQLLHAMMERWKSPAPSFIAVASGLAPLLHLCRRYDILSTISPDDDGPICGVCDDEYYA